MNENNMIRNLIQENKELIDLKFKSFFSQKDNNNEISHHYLLPKEKLRHSKIKNKF